MDADFQELIDGTLSKSAQVRTFIEIAREIEKEAQELDETLLSRHVHVSAFINHTGSSSKYSADSAFLASTSGESAFDGSLYQGGEMISGDKAAIDAALAQVTSLSDAIVFTFELSHDVIAFIMNTLAKHSPYGGGADKHSGQYMHSHVIFADGVLVQDTREIPEFASEYLFVNTLPYARKIEAGESSMAPHGVYELTANEATTRYGSTCIIEFIDYAGTYGVMSEATSTSYGRRTKLHFNKSENRFPAIRLTFPTK